MNPKAHCGNGTDDAPSPLPSPYLTSAEAAVALLKQCHKVVTPDAQQRWIIPMEMALHAGLGGAKRTIVLTPQVVWLEICEAGRKQAILQQMEQQARAGLGL